MFFVPTMYNEQELTSPKLDTLPHTLNRKIALIAIFLCIYAKKVVTLHANLCNYAIL